MAALSTSDFLNKVFVNVLGIALIAFGIFMLLSLISYDPYDPSANFIKEAVVKNWAGVTGAYIAGPIIGFIGLAGIMVVISPLSWGWNILKESTFNKIWLKITFLSICIPSLSAFFSIIDPFIDVSSNWPTNSHGGFIGAYLNDKLVPIVTI